MRADLTRHVIPDRKGESIVTTDTTLDTTMALVAVRQALHKAPTTTIGERPVHPLADLLPAMSADEFDRLKADIKAHGLHLPVLTLNGCILDGRHRARACAELGLAYPTQAVDGEPAAIVASLNLHRRHLQADQVAAIAELLRADMPEHHVMLGTAGRRVGKKAAEDAKTLGIGQATVERVRRVSRQAPDKLRDVAAGKTSAMKVLREQARRWRERDRAASLLNEVNRLVNGKPRPPISAPPKQQSALDSAVLTLQRFADDKGLIKSQRQVLNLVRGLARRYPKHHAALADFYQCLGQAFVDGSIARPTKGRRRCEQAARRR